MQIHSLTLSSKKWFSERPSPWSISHTKKSKGNSRKSVKNFKDESCPKLTSSKTWPSSKRKCSNSERSRRNTRMQSLGTIKGSSLTAIYCFNRTMRSSCKSPQLTSLWKMIDPWPSRSSNRLGSTSLRLEALPVRSLLSSHLTQLRILEAPWAWWNTKNQLKIPCLLVIRPSLRLPNG